MPHPTTRLFPHTAGRSYPLVAAAILLLAFALRAWNLGDASLWADEAWSAKWSNTRLAEFYEEILLRRSEVQLPLHMSSLHFVAAHNEFLLRFPSLMACYGLGCSRKSLPVRGCSLSGLRKSSSTSLPSPVSRGFQTPACPVHPLFVDRYLTEAQAGAIILMLVGWWRLPRHAGRYALAALVVLSGFLVVYQTISSGDDEREDWRAAAQYIAAQVEPTDSIILDADYYELAFLH